PNNVHIPTSPVLRDLEQIVHAGKPRLTGQVVGDVLEGNGRNRIDDDVAFVHPVTAADLHAWTDPDANTGRDPSAADTFSKTLGEQHIEPLDLCQAGFRPTPSRCALAPRIDGSDSSARATFMMSSRCSGSDQGRSKSPTIHAGPSTPNMVTSRNPA